MSSSADALAEINLHHFVAEFFEAGADFLGVRKLLEPFTPSVGHEGFVDDGGVGIIYRQKFQAHLSGELIAMIAFESEGRAGGESGAVVFLLIGVAAGYFCAAKNVCCSKRKITSAAMPIRKKTTVHAFATGSAYAFRGDHGDQLSAEMGLKLLPIDNPDRHRQQNVRGRHVG